MEDEKEYFEKYTKLYHNLAGKYAETNKADFSGILKNKFDNVTTTGDWSPTITGDWSPKCPEYTFPNIIPPIYPGPHEVIQKDKPDFSATLREMFPIDPPKIDAPKMDTSTGKVKCKCCDTKIPKGLPIVVIKGSGSHGGEVVAIICPCCLEMFQELIDAIIKKSNNLGKKKDKLDVDRFADNL